MHQWHELFMFGRCCREGKDLCELCVWPLTVKRTRGLTRLILVCTGPGITHQLLTGFCKLHCGCMRVRGRACFCVRLCPWPCPHTVDMFVLYLIPLSLYILIVFHVVVVLVVRHRKRVRTIFPEFTSVHLPLSFISPLSPLPLWVRVFNYQIKQDLQSAAHIIPPGFVVIEKQWLFLCHRYHSGSCCVW